MNKWWLPIVLTVGALVYMAVVSCSLNKPTQQEVQQAFTALSQATSGATTGSQSETQAGPPTWSYTITLNGSSGGTLTMVLNVSSSYNLNNPPSSGESGTFSGTITFSNFSASGYTFNGTLNLGGSFSTSTASNGDMNRPGFPGDSFR